MSALEKLTPQIVWKYFTEICEIPRPSKKEEKVIAYLLDFAQKHNLEANRDEIGNVVIRKEATQGFESKKGVVLQSHVDMVCEKNSNVNHNFDTDAIKSYIDGEWVKAEGTTLGADDGIGMAAQLALLASQDINHPAVECLFTVDEETGLSGAFALKPGFLKYNILLNLDSEDDGELFIGCAGGIDTIANLDYKTKKTPLKEVAYKITVSGLRGGHSGDDIHKGYGNSNKIINRFLFAALQKFKIGLSDFNSGNLRNAIPREGFAIFTIKPKYINNLHTLFETFKTDVNNEFSKTEPNLTIELQETEKPLHIVKNKVKKLLIKAVHACPNGVISMSKDIEGLVETSTNLASVKFTSDQSIEIVTSQRSSVDSAKVDIANAVKSTFLLAKARVRHSDGYPGWEPNTNSEILQVTKDSYIRLFNEEPEVKAIHAGLECGLFLKKYPNMDMISFGPTIRNAHSPDEMINIATVDKFWKHLIDILNNIPE